MVFVTALVASLLSFPMSANASSVSVLVCTDAQSCRVEAKTLAEFRALGGLGSCGVIPGEYTLKVVDRSGKLIGYKCAMNPYQPGM